VSRSVLTRRLPCREDAVDLVEQVCRVRACHVPGLLARHGPTPSQRDQVLESATIDGQSFARDAMQHDAYVVDQFSTGNGATIARRPSPVVSAGYSAVAETTRL
jgi:hypothetical protein